MRDFREINLEEGLPAAAEGMERLKSMIALYKKSKVKCVVVIHGYGSSGKGGEIGKKARSWLLAQKKKGYVKSVLFGEDCFVTNFDALLLKGKYPQIGEYFRVSNHGVTIVEL